MGTGYIDSASVTEIVSTYMFEKPDEVFAWNWETAQEVTCALITSNCLRLAPSLTPEGAPSGPYGETLKTLSGIVNIADIDPAIRQKATEKTKRWASRNYRKVRTNYEELKADQKYFTRWLEGGIINTWPEFSRRLGGLFDYKFVPQIASIIDTSEVDIKEIWHLSRDLNTVENYAKHQPDKDGFKLLRDAYIISVLLRGRYHEYVAVGSRLKIMHHPVRNSVLLNLQGRPKTKFPVNVAQYLSNIILASAFSEKGVDNRIARWAENMIKVRKGMIAGNIPISLEYNEDALNRAVEAAQNLRISNKPWWLGKALDGSFALGTAILTSFYLVEWEALITSGIAYAATYKKSPGELIGAAIYEREGNLRDLAK